MTDLLDDIDELVSKNEVIPREAPPTPAFKTVRERLSGRSKPPPKKAPEKKTAPARAATTVAKKPGPKPKPVRRPLGESIAKLVLQAGRFMNTMVDPPTGAAIMFEAGALGAAIDTAIAGTAVDRLAQKGAGVAERFEPLVPLVTMPAMIFLLSRGMVPEKMIEGELREALEDVLVQSLPLLRQRAARTKATTEAIEELKLVGSSLPGLEGLSLNTEDPIADILRSFFTFETPLPEPTEGGDGA
jgi:hypothetical protein